MTSKGALEPVAGADAGLAAEVERLRSLLDRQPSCLMRIAMDGTLLAVNDAALSLIGARNLAQALGTSVMALMRHGAAGIWEDFTDRVQRSGSASVEFEIRDLAGGERTVLLQAVVLPAHPDGIESMLVTARDVSTARRLESSLHEQAEQKAAARVRELEARIEELTGTRDQLQAMLDAARAERREIEAAFRELKSGLSQALDAALLAQATIERRVQE
jgi:outer membrane murein-binding lipoprotein Lpp